MIWKTRLHTRRWLQWASNNKTWNLMFFSPLAAVRKKYAVCLLVSTPNTLILFLTSLYITGKNPKNNSLWVTQITWSHQMPFFPLKNLRVNKILIAVIIPWKSLREPSYLYYLEKQQILALENLDGGVSPCLRSLALVSSRSDSRIPVAVSPPRLPGAGPGSPRLRPPVRTARSIPGARSRNVLLLCYWTLIKVRRLFMVRSSKWHLVFWR